MKIVPIGRGMLRITVRSKIKRAKLATVPGVLIDEDRVIFPEEIAGAITGSLKCMKRKRSKREKQMDLFDGGGGKMRRYGEINGCRR